MKNKKRAFTLTELLVVVIVLGTLAAVAVPKFSRVLETRRTSEAEKLLSAVRTEQEKRCSLGQNYTGDLGNIPTVAYAKTSASQGKTSNYTYTLTSTGIEASRSGKDYVIKIPSYKTGQMCCEGSGCDALNKSYPSCTSLSLPASDECAASDVVQPTDPCDTDPNSCACSTYAAGHRCECDADYASLNACECNPSTAACCGEGEEWNPQTGACEPTDECIEEYGEAVKVSAASDTCDGDGTSKYTCDGHFNGTCTDVYTQGRTVKSLSSSVQDPFLMFKEAVFLAYSPTACTNGREFFSAGVGQCPANAPYGCCCLPSGYSCSQLSVDDAKPVDQCPEGQVWNADTGKCVALGIELPNEHLCRIGYHYDETLGECVEDSEEEDSELDAPTIYKREVTCCGDGAPSRVEESCQKNPNQAKCCTGCSSWNGSRCATPVCTLGQELNPDTCKCEDIEGDCTADARTFWNATEKRCECPGSNQYFHNGECCSASTPKSNTKCWSVKQIKSSWQSLVKDHYGSLYRTNQSYQCVMIGDRYGLNGGWDLANVGVPSGLPSCSSLGAGSGSTTEPVAAVQECSPIGQKCISACNVTCDPSLTSMPTSGPAKMCDFSVTMKECVASNYTQYTRLWDPSRDTRYSCGHTFTINPGLQIPGGGVVFQ